MTASDPTDDVEAGSVRLIFEYDGDEVRLASRQHVAMLAPPSDELEGFEQHAGFWAELRDPGGELLHRQVLRDPIRRDAEVFSPDPTQTITRIPVEQPKGLFVVVVPDTAAADHVALVSTGEPPSAAVAGPAAAVGPRTRRFPLRESPAGREGEA
jgi:hypothetical protein